MKLNTLTQDAKRVWSLSHAVRVAIIAASGAALLACTSEQKPTEQRPLVELNPDPYPSRYHALDSVPTVIENVSILDGIGGVIKKGMILMEGGNIKAIGEKITVPQGAKVVDGTGKWVTPGIIDTHSHLGVYPTPSVDSHSDGNEMTKPVTAEVWAEHAVWPQDAGFSAALAGGITSLQILPGSANLVGGRTVTLKNVPNRSVQEMKFPGAPHGLKMACGENPKRVYGQKGGPGTRMGNVAGYRSSWIEAREYKKKWDEYRKKHAAGEDVEAPVQDLKLDTLAGVLNGDIKVHMHCYRADEMSVMMDVMKEFNYQISSFHHAVESYKIADKLAENNVCSSMWADWWGFKMEAYDAIEENVGIVHSNKACAIVHSDSDLGIQRLNQEAGKALGSANRAGLNISKEDAWQWLSANPAKSMGIFDQTGSLEVGKDADVVLWSADPFSTYALAEHVYIDGALVYDRNNPDLWPVSDFELDQPGEGER
ncbi:amidohydrolase family protein [Paraneptunicella aestuarii]|uniref:amidohydrolase n=1 Tax=Paraneptunicella aestuarii TaxID=2831148 RepID=UPI001E28CD55|nr:amidohydrolase [Paraneptunicella aestuarii]UAA37377.1 amidohydrolase family protein [Paraneptunicella aestuarii]